MFFSKSFINDYSNQMIDAINRFLVKKTAVTTEEKSDKMSYFCDYEIDMMETLGINTDGLLNSIKVMHSYPFSDEHIDPETNLNNYVKYRNQICRTIISKYINMHTDDPCLLAEYDVLWGIKEKIDKYFEYLEIPDWPENSNIYPLSKNVLLVRKIS